MQEHPLRAAVLGEMHARPFVPLATPARLMHFAFMADAAACREDRERLGAFCLARGVAGPQPDTRFHHVPLSGGELRWEQHSEFITYTWRIACDHRTPFAAVERPHAPMSGLPAPGPLLVALDLHLLPEAAALSLEDIFDRASLAASIMDGGAALAATDFRPDERGAVRILVLDLDLSPARAGALTQRLIEIETYRTLALLGLPEAQRLAPGLRQMEEELARITRAMRETVGATANSALLDELTALAAVSEAESASSSYRFGASRAYDRIVQQRLDVIGEEPYEGLPTWAAFLARRLAPAMRTVQTLEERQANLSRKLARAATLLRTRVDVEIEQQNRDLLVAMNNRTRLQLRLQQTVEGLSVAAISYYVVGLLGYLAKGAKEAGLPVSEPGLATAAAVPLAVLAVWLVVRRIRRRHAGEDHP